MAELHLHWHLSDGPHDAHLSDTAPAVIGRSAENDIVLPSDRVSRRQALVRRRGEGFTIRDLTEGRNPPVLNGTRVTAESLLGSNDTLTLGDIALTVAAITGIGPMTGPALTLSWFHDGRTHTETVRGGDPAIIGREETAAIQIDTPTVSRAHARISEHGGRFAIADLTEGRNPVRVNDKPIAGERFLNPGDVIRLGHSDIAVRVIATTGNATMVTPVGVRLVRCVNCHREVDSRLLICPWCGTSLDIAETVLPR